MSASEALNAVSSAAVVVTLYFLFLQMRQTNKNQQAILQQGRSARMSAALALRTEPLLAEAWSRAQRGDTTLDGPQIEALNAWFTAAFYSVEDSFLQHKAGLLPPGAWQSEIAWVRTFLAMPYVRVAWTINRFPMAKDFVDYVDGLMAEIKPSMPFDLAKLWNGLVAREISKTQPNPAP
jgi:hypothetical protein